MVDRGSTSGKLPTSTISTQKRLKRGSDTKRGSPELLVALCCLYSQGETYSVPDGPKHMFSKIHISATVYLFNIFSPGSSSYGYLKDIT